MLNLDTGLLFLFGIAIFGGILSALVFKKAKVPQVLGYIVAGIIIGQSGFKLISLNHINHLTPFNYFALGIIGFLVGSEIHFSDMKKYGKQFSLILLAEGILAFLLVGSAVTGILYWITGSLAVALAGGMVFGAIASATDPASTINVIWEYRAAGILTTTVIAIVALDDALAMFLYGLGTSLSQILTGGNADVTGELLKVFLELASSVALGVATGFAIGGIIWKVKHKDTIFVLSFGLLLICVGLAVLLNLDIILAAMFAGVTLVNFIPARSKEVVENIRGISTPIYILFFVLVGARISLATMPFWLWLIIIGYVVLRSAGKFSGAWIGARMSKAEPKVARFTGMSLFAQGGVAIGLSIMASQHLGNIIVSDGMTLGDVIIFGVTTTTLLVQLIGPFMVKLAVIKAGEAGKNVTVEDVIDKWSVRERIEADSIQVPVNATVRDILKVFNETEDTFVSVLDKNGLFLGIISFNDIKAVFLDQSTWDWLIAGDFMTKTKNFALADQNLTDAVTLMDQLGLDQMPVLTDGQSGKWLGVIDRKNIRAAARKQILTPA